MRVEGNIKCKIEIDRLIYPKSAKEHGHGDFAVFLATVTESYCENISSHTKIKVSGKASSIEKRTPYILVAKKKHLDKYGDEYQIITMNMNYDLQSPIEQRVFLERILTDTQVNNLYESLDNPFDAIKSQDIEALCSVKGIGSVTARKMIDKYYSNIGNARIYIELADYGMTDGMIDKLSIRYGSADTALFKVKENPYILIEEVDGIGWKKADEIASKSGIDEQSVKRVSAYICHYLRKQSELGNSWCYVDTVVEACVHNLNLTSLDPIREAIRQLGEEDLLWWDDKKRALARPEVRELEKNIAAELYRLQSAKSVTKSGNLSAAISEAQEQYGIEYTEEQAAAIELVSKNNVSIITGYGGTGKSSVVSAVLKALPGASFAQTALSGRAAARLSEITGEKGVTIHRLLEYDPNNGYFNCNKEHPLEYDIIILDEVSMIGAQQFYSLLQAIKDGAKLIMIGDDGQLESIGLCNVFKDMLISGTIPAARLTKIHRQAAKSAIITESIQVRSGWQLFETGWIGTETRGELKDLELDIYKNPLLSQKMLIDKYKEVYDTVGDPRDIQIILAQKYRGELSTSAINPIIQRIVNPYGKNEIYVSTTQDGNTMSYSLREGDLVIANKNNYKTLTPDNKTCPIYNGNRGIVKTINMDTREMIITFDQWGDVVIPDTLRDTIELAYALTCHKLQGSEAKYVIIGLNFSARVLLTREWLYTAITRAKKKCIISGESGAISYCVSHSNVPYKRTFLQQFLALKFAQ